MVHCDENRLGDCVHLILYHLFLSCIADESLDRHFCSSETPCRTAFLALWPLLSLRTVSSTWSATIKAITAHGEHVFFRRVEEAYYPHKWHISTKVRKDIILRRYRIFNTISTESGDRGVYQAYDFGSSPLGCRDAETRIIKAWTSPVDRECLNETNAYDTFQKTSPLTGIPSALASSYDSNCDVYVIVLQHLGPTLEHLLQLVPNNCFDERMVVAVAIQILDRYREIHSQGIIHNGTKPGNVCLSPRSSQSIESRPTLYIIDFGFSSLFDLTSTGPLPSAHRADTLGNRTFLSVLGHHGVTRSQRDDLESLAYFLSFLRHGSVPWAPAQSHRIRHSPLEDSRPQLWRLKMSTPASTLFRDMDGSFIEFWKDVKSLGFGETPDYEVMKGRFEDCWRRKGFEGQPGMVDWWDVIDSVRTEKGR